MRGIKKLIIALFTIGLLIVGFLRPDSAIAEYKYQLYQNHESFGILVFPAENIFAELDEFIQKSGFNSVESGHSIMRFGPNNENQTYMMPESVQKNILWTALLFFKSLPRKIFLSVFLTPNGD